MDIFEINVTVGTILKNPTDKTLWYVPNVMLKAKLQPGDDVNACVKELQAKADDLFDQRLAVLTEKFKKEELQKDIKKLEQQAQYITLKIQRLTGILQKPVETGLN